MPRPSGLELGPAEHLEQLRRITEAVDIPVVASLNGTSLGGSIRHAPLLEEVAGRPGASLRDVIVAIALHPKLSDAEIVQ